MSHNVRKSETLLEISSRKAIISEGEKDFILRNILCETKKFVTAQQFDIWFSCLKIRAITNSSLVFLTPNNFIREWLHNNYVDLFSGIVYKILNSSREVIFSSGDESHEKSLDTSCSADNVSSKNVDLYEETYTVPISKYYSFENFIVGTCNRLAHAAAIAVAESPGQAFNPLFIYGGSGLGKTHLLYAISNLLASKGTIKTLYVSCERFVNHYISTIRSNSWDIFRRLYRDIDVLLIDDIHFFENSQGSREEFFHIFNYLYSTKKQIVITSDCPPEAIGSLEDRLVSRFKWGLLCGIDAPAIETRIAIIEKLSLLWGIDLSHEMAQYLAENVAGNIREIEGAIIRLSKEAKVIKNSFTLDFVKKVVHNLSEGKKYVGIEAIITLVSNKFGVSVSQILSKYRTKSLTLPRHIIMYLSRKLTNMSLTEIGGYLGGKDHSTVLHADEKIKRTLKKDKNLLFILQKLENELQKNSGL
ncbi:MAG: chromosomal replication initiator protein DnaA [Planctomycetota bacterium]|nr:chromosomal replication initiator protein DnaA [Planctomycetota bacterium]MDE1888680.1 chromosomal replication initiator protein DnaA [Planctomycetota bacterium]MDE2215802.1 chromosomal replication initiator protein DnaA [Planctomycetota bacterium]